MNKQKYIRVQRLITTRMAKAYRTTSSEAFCMLTGTTPITIKPKEVVKRYKIKEKSGNRTMEMDHDVEFKYCPHPPDAVTIDEVVGNEEASVHAYKDSKHDQGVGSGVVTFKGSKIVAKS